MKLNGNNFPALKLKVLLTGFFNVTSISVWDAVVKELKR
jgi:hypothetical protein